MEKQISKTVLKLFLFIVLMVGCAKQEPMNNEYVMQIKNVGLRQGVFVRRYKLTRDYGNNQVFTPEILKKFIDEILVPDYLFIQHAYDLGFRKERKTQQNINDYRVNLLASSHPIIFEEMTILKEQLRDFYGKKSIKYDIDLVQTNSYSMADSIYKSMLAGNEINLPKKDVADFNFPQYLHYKDVTYGERLHPDIFSTLIKMKQSEISEPIYTAPIWTIIKLNNKSENKGLKSFEAMEKELLRQGQAIFKYEKQKQLVNELREKYQPSVRTEFYQPLISAYKLIDNHGWIDKNKFNKTDLKVTFLQINDDEISLSHFISSFNQAHQFSLSLLLTEKDLGYFVDDYVAQYLLYLDALEKGVDQNPLIKDQLENKEHRILLTKYLKEEIAHKVVISDDDARKHYENNREKWRAKYEDVASSVKNDLKNKRLLEKKNNLKNKLKKKYQVRYNESLLREIAEQLTNEKKLKNKEVIKH
jgi:hypothetical protein